MTSGSLPQARPADVARSLLRALEASEGRRKRRMRDTTPDAIGQSLERDLLLRVAADDPEPEAFEAWLFDHCREAGLASGPLRAVAGKVLDEWRLAHASPDFRAWLGRGAPSDDREEGERRSPLHEPDEGPPRGPDHHV